MSKLLTPGEAIRAMMEGKEIEYMALNFSNEKIGWCKLEKSCFIELLLNRELLLSRELRLKPQKVKKYQYLYKDKDGKFVASIGSYKNIEEAELNIGPTPYLKIILDSEKEFDE